MVYLAQAIGQQLCVAECLADSECEFATSMSNGLCYLKYHAFYGQNGTTGAHPDINQTCLKANTGGWGGWAGERASGRGEGGLSS